MQVGFLQCARQSIPVANPTRLCDAPLSLPALRPTMSLAVFLYIAASERNTSQAHAFLTRGDPNAIYVIGHSAFHCQHISRKMLQPSTVVYHKREQSAKSVFGEELETECRVSVESDSPLINVQLLYY
ncbi:uncharacterized protein ARMOST_13292 [Armillaria ostoyae]|uniref:Uncharacterized protein n=1 Tax=Armillaria ostoyae TaxID=47428 RepID=A0A284RMG8_ARMOS|nr:uncharacterized protein ARMOST_13292 [Armillaria ostoyae]